MFFSAKCLQNTSRQLPLKIGKFCDPKFDHDLELLSYQLLLPKELYKKAASKKVPKTLPYKHTT